MMLMLLVNNPLTLGSLAYRPFLDPINAHGWWLFLSIPLVVGISVAYKAIRLPGMQYYWNQVIKMSVQVLVALVVLCGALYVLVEVALPYL